MILFEQQFCSGGKNVVAQETKFPKGVQVPREHPQVSGSYLVNRKYICMKKVLFFKFIENGWQIC